VETWLGIARDVRFAYLTEALMTSRTRLLFGPLAALLLGLGIALLPLMLSDYNAIRQTVSEIGEMDSPARIPFTILMCTVAAMLLVFASGVRDVSRAAGHSSLAALFIVFTAISGTGVAIFAFPHPLHNVFGLSETVGYQAPLVMALTWRRDARARELVRLSWIMFALVWVAIALNLATIDRHGALFAFERPFYGLVQRSLFASWFAWVALAGLWLYRRTAQASARSSAANA
jgi:hypothetical protein